MSAVNSTGKQSNWAIRMVDSVISRHPYLTEKWHYEFGLMLKAIEQVWRATGDPKYFDYIKHNVDRFVDEEGNIRTYTIGEYNIDQVNSGKILLFMYQETKDERYRKASCLLRKQLETHPRTSAGGFWHKQIYPHQMWLDGLFMGAPFYAEYAKLFNEPAIFDDVVKQITLLKKYTEDPQTGLLYHGWDESRAQAWADPETGCSPNFWGRAMGWYMMAVADVLDFLPVDHPMRDTVIEIYQQLAINLAVFQEKNTGLWYQVLDQGDRPGNYFEGSASSMLVYAYAKGARKGYLEGSFVELAKKGFDGIIKNLITVDSDNQVNLNQICSVAGLGRYLPEQPYRDGSFEYYIKEPVVANDYKGVGPFILAAAELELKK